MHPQDAVPCRTLLPQLRHDLGRQLVRRQIIGHRDVLLPALQVRTVTPHPQGHALAQVHGIQRRRIDVAQLLHRRSQPFRSQTATFTRTEPEILQPLGPVLGTRCNLIQVGLHIGCEIVIHQPGQVLLQQLHHAKRQPRRHQRLPAPIHVLAIHNGRNRRGVGRGPSDTAFLHRLNQGRIRIARWRRSEVLPVFSRVEVAQGKFLVRVQLRQSGSRGRGRDLGVFAVVALLVAAFFVGGEEARFGDNRSRGREFGLVGGDAAAGLNLHRDGCADGVIHLAGQGAFENQLIKLQFRRVQLRGQGGRQTEGVSGWANRLVGFLGTLGLGFIESGLCRHRVLAVTRSRQGTRRGNGLLRQIHRVGTHIGDEAVFVQGLGGAHGVAGIHPQFARGFLLQRRSGERRGRATPIGLGFHFGDLPRGVAVA